MSRRIKIFDTTLRDGEQSPGVNLNIKEKLIIAKKLEGLKVDVIEAGFPMASKGDFESVLKISQEIKESTIAALCRAVKKDIDLAYESIKNSNSGRIHTFIATSPIHMKYKLNMSEDQVIENAIEAVKYSKKFCNDVEFSAEDAYRSNIKFLIKIFEEVIKAGATVINIPDTVGYAIPKFYGDFIKEIISNTKGIENVDVSVHCHNDLGMATANSIEGILSGASQIECAINGLGERAGNTALEEVVMAIETRKKDLNIYTAVNTKGIWGISKAISSITGIQVQPNKAIVGENAFVHESGIHQDGVLKEKSTYEIVTPESIGKINNNNLVLGKHSGRHAFDNYLRNNGITLSAEELEEAFLKFKKMTDKKKNISYKEIEAIVNSNTTDLKETYKLISYQVYSGNKMICTTTVEIEKNNKILIESAVGDGPVSSAFKAIERTIGKKVRLKDYSIKSITDGDDSLGEVIVKIEENNKIFVGSSLSGDVMEASINAFINAINKMIDSLN
ncbi:2-isopropylmalate synthase [Clostridium tarantellae]|uniref:2-isopropylmalate synthase n=1 Tax=Clostridium tarantellae TaxID=39493 RepID=A0A6I1MPV2_9CLOT|nr:2-isopropylmalate synthase [Clostridium tarantellae]MPQ42319.1 2-isopropylmalate synthase [Clostridium tarantellae]